MCPARGPHQPEMALTSRNSSIPQTPPSRARPEALVPPNGAPRPRDLLGELLKLLGERLDLVPRADQSRVQLGAPPPGPPEQRRSDQQCSADGRRHRGRQYGARRDDQHDGTHGR